MKGNIDAIHKKRFLNFADECPENFAVATVSTGFDRNDLDVDVGVSRLNHGLNHVRLAQGELAASRAQANCCTVCDFNFSQLLVGTA
jgi:hypothetical protein